MMNIHISHETAGPLKRKPTDAFPLLGGDSDGDGQQSEEFEEGPTIEELCLEPNLTTIERILLFLESDLLVHRIFIVKDILKQLTEEELTSETLGTCYQDHTSHTSHTSHTYIIYIHT